MPYLKCVMILPPSNNPEVKQVTLVKEQAVLSPMALVDLGTVGLLVIIRIWSGSREMQDYSFGKQARQPDDHARQRPGPSPIL